jgi:hypothetical protein
MILCLNFLLFLLEFLFLQSSRPTAFYLLQGVDGVMLGKAIIQSSQGTNCIFFWETR